MNENIKDKVVNILPPPSNLPHANAGSFIVNPTSYEFKTSEDMIINYEYSTQLDYGYLYGFGDTVYSISSTTSTMRFPKQSQEGNFSCYIGSYSANDEWIQSNEFTITISDYSQSIPVASVSLDKTSHTFTNYSTTQLTATVLPTNATDKSVTWLSSNTSVASVSSTGLVTARSNGSATITCRTVDGNKTATCNVTVNTSSSGINVNPTSYKFKQNEDIVINYNGGKVSTAYLYNLDSTSIATGNITSNTFIFTPFDKIGTYTDCYVGGYLNSVWVTSNRFSITIEENASTTVPVTSVTVSPTNKSCYVDDNFSIIATVLPTNASDKSVTWSSSNTSIATVSSSGLVTAKAKGSCTITCRSNSNTDKQSTCSVTVSDKPVDVIPVSSVSVSPASKTCYVNDSFVITHTVLPSNATNKNVVWSSSNTSIATVNNGSVSAKNVGSCVITCTSSADSSKKATCSVTVKSSSGGTGGVDSALIDYRNRLASLREAMHSATVKIAQVKADKSESNSNKFTESQIKIASDTINLRVASVESKQSASDKKVDSLESWKKEAEVKITDSAIVSTVTSSTNWTTQTNKINTAQNTANAANSNLTTLTSRVDSAEQKITPSAIVSTVTSSSTYKNDLTGKVSTDKVMSSINQSAEKIKISANKIQLEGTTTIGNSNGDKVKINNADYEIYNGSKTKGFFGLRELGDGRHICRLAMSHSGLDKYTNNYFVANAYPSDNNPLGTGDTYIDMAYRCQRFVNENQFGDVSNIRMLADGTISVAPIKEFNIYTNYVNGSYTNSASERLIATFESSQSQYFDQNLVIPCVRRKGGGTGLILGHYNDNSQACLVRVGVDTTGFRAFRPVTGDGNISLGSASYPFEKLTTSKGVYSSEGVIANNISTLTNDEDNIDILDNINFIESFNSNRFLKMDVTNIKNTDYVEVKDDNTYINHHEMIKLLLKEVKELKGEIETLKAR